MSLITRCPACGTLFRVVEDQLKISEGWVRCGQCSEVFDARLHIEELVASPAPSPAPSPAAQSPVATPAGTVASAPVSPGTRAPDQAESKPGFSASRSFSDSLAAIQALPSSAKTSAAPQPESAERPSASDSTGFAPSRPPAADATPAPSINPAPAFQASKPSADDINRALAEFALQRKQEASPFALGAEPPGFALSRSPLHEGPQSEPPGSRNARLAEDKRTPAKPHADVPTTAPTKARSGARATDGETRDMPSSFMPPDGGFDSAYTPSAPAPLERAARGLPASRSFEPTGSSYLDAGYSTQADALPSLPPDSTPQELQAVPGFVQQAQREARWRSPWVRLFMSLLTLGLLAALAAQVAVHNRDWLAARVPDSRAPLEQLCEPLACQIGPLRRIESLVVDASGFNKLPAPASAGSTAVTREAYRLTLTLRNNDTMAVAMPHVELSLQDGQEQTVLRRVLAPAELGATNLTLAERSEWSGAATLQLEAPLTSPGGAAVRITGYRLYVFYP